MSDIGCGHMENLIKETFQFSGKKMMDSRNGVDLIGSPSGEKTKVDTTSYLLLLYTVINLRWVWFKDLTVSEQRNM